MIIRLHIVMRVEKMLETAHLRVQKVPSRRTAHSTKQTTMVLGLSTPVLQFKTVHLLVLSRKYEHNVKYPLKGITWAPAPPESRNCPAAAVNQATRHTPMLVHIIYFLYYLLAPQTLFDRPLNSHNWPQIPP